MNGIIKVTAQRKLLGLVGYVRVNTDAEGHLWVEGFTINGLVPCQSVEAAKGQELVIVTESGRTLRPGRVEHITCTSKTLGEYEASGFWAGAS